MPKLKPLGQILARSRSLPWSLSLYVPKHMRCSLDSKCVTLEPGAEDDSEVRGFLADHGLVYGLSMSTVQRIVEKAGNSAHWRGKQCVGTI